MFINILRQVRTQVRVHGWGFRIDGKHIAKDIRIALEVFYVGECL